MDEFTAKYAEKMHGVISGFDRLVFRGTLRAIRYAEGMKAYLIRKGVWVGDFAQHVQAVSERLKESSPAEARKLGRTILYLASSQIDKDAVARGIATRQKITSGLVCVLSCVEPCRSFEVYRNRETKKLELVSRLRKCLFLYHYAIHLVFGFMNARIQTWFPFPVQICLNGREWLGRQMEAEGLKYVRQDNCFPWIEDFARAQQLQEQQGKLHWRKHLDAIADQLHPLRAELFDDFPASYYWSTYQSEWARDSALFEAISRGEWTVRGFRNADLQRLLFSQPAASAEQKRRRSAWVSRQLRLLRAHHLIQKVPHENRYHLTTFGRLAVTTVLAARRASVSDLNEKAA